MYLKVTTSIFVLLGEVVGLVPSHAPIKGCLSGYVVGELGRGPCKGARLPEWGCLLPLLLLPHAVLMCAWFKGCERPSNQLFFFIYLGFSVALTLDDDQGHLGSMQFNCVPN